jgi:SAM-dependent methyltransferase
MTLLDKPQYFGKDLEAMSFAHRYHQWIYTEFESYLGERVAEVGAGAGSFSTVLLQSPIIKHFQAYEPSGNMFPLLQEKLSNRSNALAINDFFGKPSSCQEEPFDALVYVNVLEHIEDDQKELQNAFQALKPGGHILLLVPALPWLYSELDRRLGHFRRYYKKELVAKVGNTGFSIIKAKYFDGLGIIPWYVFFTLLKKNITGGNVSLYDKIAVPLLSTFERIVPPPIGKNVLLIGQK